MRSWGSIRVLVAVAGITLTAPIFAGPASAADRPGFTLRTVTISGCTNWARVDEKPLVCFSPIRVSESVQVDNETGEVWRKIGDAPTDLWQSTEYVWDAASNVASRPIDPLPAIGGSASSYAFLGGSKQHPAHYSRCRPIHWGADLTALKEVGLHPDWELHRLKLVMAALSKRSGQKFRYVPNVTVRSSSQSGVFVSGPLRSASQPMAISFGSPDFADSSYRWTRLEGAGGFASPQISGSRIVSSYLVMNTTMVAGLHDTGGINDSYDFIATVYLHEVMHALGMAHVGDPTAIMNPGPVSSRLSRGDIAGLRRLTAQPCS